MSFTECFLEKLKDLLEALGSLLITFYLKPPKLFRGLITSSTLIAKLLVMDAILYQTALLVSSRHVTSNFSLHVRCCVFVRVVNQLTVGHYVLCCTC